MRARQRSYALDVIHTVHAFVLGELAFSLLLIIWISSSMHTYIQDFNFNRGRLLSDESCYFVLSQHWSQRPRSLCVPVFTFKLCILRVDGISEIIGGNCNVFSQLCGLFCQPIRSFGEMGKYASDDDAPEVVTKSAAKEDAIAQRRVEKEARRSNLKRKRVSR